MLNASFVFAPTPNPSPPQNSTSITINGFDNADGDLTVDAGTMSNGDAAYVFSLDNNTWDGVTTPLFAEVAGSSLRIAQSLFSTSTSLDLLINKAGNEIGAIVTVVFNTAIDTNGGDFRVDTDGTVSAQSIDTTGDAANEDSGNVTINAGLNVMLRDTITTAGFDNNASAADSAAGNVTITTVNGNITTAAISAVGGDNNDADALANGEGGVITLNANALNPVARGDVIIDGAINTSTEAAATIKVNIDADRDVTINQAIVTRGGYVDIDAGRNITSTADGDIRTTGDKANEDSGNVTMDTTNAALTGNVTLAGFIVTSGFDNNASAADSAAGNVTITTVNGNITTAAISAVGGDNNDADALANGEGGVITLNANALNPVARGDVIIDGAINTSTEAAATIKVNIDADRDVKISRAIVTRGGYVDIDAGRDIRSIATGDIRTTGDIANEDSGNVTMDTTNAAANGNITLEGFIDTRGIDNAAAGKGGLIQLTTVNGNITTQAGATLNAEGGDAGADGVPDDNGGVIALDAVTGSVFDSAASIQNNQIELAAHGLQTGDLVIYTNGGGTDIGGLTNGKTYAVIVVDANNIRLAATQEAAINNGTAISITSDAVGTAHRLVTTRGDVTLGDIIRTSNNGVVRLEASGRIVDGTGPLGTKAVNIIAPALLMRAQTGIGDGGSGNAADIRIDGAGLPGASGIRIAAVTNSGDINITSLANLTTVTDVVGGGTIQSFDAGDASD